MRGFTFVEVLVLISVTAIVGFTIETLIANFYIDNDYILESTKAIDNAHRGLRASFQDLREASYGADGSYPLQNVATSTITFYSDVDGNGVVDKIRLYLSNGSFYLGVTDPTSSPPTYVGQPEATTTIAQYVRNGTSSPIFRFYDDNGVELVATSSPIDISAVRSISTALMIDVNPNRAPDILTLMETATLRNLR